MTMEEIKPVEPIELKPIFEVCVGNPAGDHKTYRIYANGLTQGFEDGNKPVIVTNNIPMALNTTFRVGELHHEAKALRRVGGYIINEA